MCTEYWLSNTGKHHNRANICVKETAQPQSRTADVQQYGVHVTRRRTEPTKWNYPNKKKTAANTDKPNQQQTVAKWEGAPNTKGTAPTKLAYELFFIDDWSHIDLWQLLSALKNCSNDRKCSCGSSELNWMQCIMRSATTYTNTRAKLTVCTLNCE